VASREWNPDLYGCFADLRSRPFWDLAALIDATAVRSMVDLGCGSGELTVELAERLDVTSAVGVDSSPAMLAVAKESTNERVTFEQGDIATWTATEPVDLIVANASLQWVPDHHTVIERWTTSLSDGGQIAIQVPANAGHPSHTCSAEVAAREPFASAMGGAPPADPVATNVLAPEQYAELLFDLGVADPHVRLQVYPQVMESTADVVDWTSGTSLTRFFALLPEELHEPFVDAYRTELLAAVGDHAPYFYAFKRILMYGRLGALRV
jgi:trans-aconitate 2-methyltransferase